MKGVTTTIHVRHINTLLSKIRHKLVIAQHKCNMPYIALEQHNALGACGWPSAIVSSAIFGMLHKGACNN